jgi:hypothetical protein
MAGRGPAPKINRRLVVSGVVELFANEPAGGDGTSRVGWQHGEVAASTSRVGWQHGEVPQAASRLRAESKLVWTEWFDAWFAAYWNVSDLPTLRRLIRLWDLCERAIAEPFVKGTTVRRPAPHTEVRQLLDSLGITPKGQQERRWLRPSPPPPSQAVEPPSADTTNAESPYSHLMN